MPDRLRALVLSVAACLFLAVPAKAADVREYSRGAFLRAEQVGQRVMVFVSSRWRPRRIDMEPMIWSLASDFRYNDVLFLRLDFDRQKDGLRDLRLNADAIVLVYKGGQERGRISDSADEEELRRLLDSAH